MSLTIWKAVLQVNITEQTIQAPDGAEFLSVHEQYGQLAVWFRCNPDAPKVARRLAVCGTGADTPTNATARYIGTASLFGGDLILHVFEI